MEHSGFEQKQRDHELFLQAFEKPTQIYRYLKMRSQLSPYFLNRNLYYMKYGMTKRRSKKSQAKREQFKIDDLLKKKEKFLDDAANAANVGGYMTLTFLGFYDKKITETPDDKVRLEVLLVQLCKSKLRSETENPTRVVKIQLRTDECPVNPNEDIPPKKAPSLSIPTNLYNVDVDKRTKDTDYEVVIRVYQDREDRHDEAENLNPNLNHYSHHMDDGYRQAKKRRKLIYLETDFRIWEENGERKPLITGEYEFLLKERYDDSSLQEVSNNNQVMWDILDRDQINEKDAFSVFATAPSIKFRLQWTDDPSQATVERPRSLMPRETEETETQRWDRERKETSTNMVANMEGSNQTKIFYHFLYNNNTRQITANSSQDYICQWCQLNCLELYCLLKHLKLTHPRFLFNYMAIPEGARINVSVSEMFDSTYVGNPYDIIRQPSGQPGHFFSKNGPHQMTPLTDILVARPNRAPPCLAEFLEVDDNDANGQYEAPRSFVSGHNRAYHYSTSNLPMSAKAVLEGDGEDISDPPWLQIKTSKMIDDFTDVNEGEKEFMKVWNRHVQHYTFVGDCQMPQALKMFIEEKGEEIVRKNLYRNFSLHLINLYEFGIIGSAHVFTAQSRMQEFVLKRNLHKEINWGGKLGEKLATALSFKEDKKPQLSKPPRKNFAGLFPNQSKK